jgi:hypothetical protein
VSGLFRIGLIALLERQKVKIERRQKEKQLRIRVLRLLLPKRVSGVAKKQSLARLSHYFEGRLYHRE